MEIGQRVGRGIVIATDIRVDYGGHARKGARLRCDCGNVYEASLTALRPRAEGRPANTQSCGCLRKDHIKGAAYRGGKKPTHGMSNHPLYVTWVGIVHRCEDPKFHKYPRYGGRGIKLCERWHDARLFIEDIERELGPRPDGCTLDRKDNDGDYEPGNVQWATFRQQQANTSRPRHGIHQVRGKWVARLHLGRFKSEEEAAAVYQRAVEILEREGVLA